MIPAHIYLSSLVPQILLGLIFSWRLCLLAAFSPHFFEKVERIFITLFGLITINYLIWGHVLWDLLAGKIIFPWPSLPTGFLIIFLVMLNSWITSCPQVNAQSKLQSRLWDYGLIVVLAIYSCDRVFYICEKERVAWAQHLESTQLLSDLKREVTKSKQENDILRKEEAALILKQRLLEQTEKIFQEKLHKQQMDRRSAKN
jgi:hypothetical protein